MAGYNPSQERDYHGRWGSGGNPNGSSGKTAKLTGKDAKISDRLADQIAKAARTNAARDQKQRAQKIEANRKATMRAQKAAQDATNRRASQMASGIHPSQRGTNSGRSMGYSGAGGGGGGGYGGGAGGRGGTPGQQQLPSGADIGDGTGVNVQRFKPDDGGRQKVRLSPAARDAVNRFRAADASLYHNTGSMPHAAHVAKMIASSHGVHSTGVVSLPRSMKITSKASANPGTVSPSNLPRNSSEKFTGGPPRPKRGSLESGTGTKL